MSAGQVLIAGLATAVILVTAFIALARKLRGPQDSFPLSLLRASCWIYCRVVHRLRIESAAGDPLPAKGGCIVVSNHQSGLDPMAIAMATRRQIRFLMAREYYDIPLLGGLFRALRLIPVNRDGHDLSAMKDSIRGLKNGDVLGIFPQGGIRDAGPPTGGKDGVALLTLRTGAPVVPVYVDGSKAPPSMLRTFLTPSRTVVRAGPLLVFEKLDVRKIDRDELGRVTQKVLDGIAALAPAATKTGKPF